MLKRKNGLTKIIILIFLFLIVICFAGWLNKDYILKFFQKSEPIQNLTVQSTDKDLEKLGKYSRDPEIKERLLDNGLIYFYRENKQPANTVELKLVVKTGSANEKKGTYGLAHFLEHMIFNGSESYKAGEIKDKLMKLGASFGGDLNAMTSFDSTTFYVTLPNTEEALKEGLKIMSEMAGKVTFPKEEIEKERGVILEEMRVYLGPQDTFFKKMLTTLFKQSPYQRMISGVEENVSKITREDFLDFYNNWYRTDNMILSIVGDVKEDLVDKYVKENFSYLKKPETKLLEIITKEPNFTGARIDYSTHPENTYDQLLIESEKTPINLKNKSDREKVYELQLAISILNNRFADILDQNEKGIISMNANLNQSTFINEQGIDLTIIFQEKNINEMLIKIYEEYLRLAQYGTQEKELNKAKEEFMVNFDQMVNNKASIENSYYSNDISNSFIFNNNSYSLDYLKKEYDDFNKDITLEKINSLIKEYFDNNNLAIVGNLKPTSVTKFDKTKLEETLNQLILKKDLTEWKDLYSDIKPYSPNVSTGKIISEVSVDSINAKKVVFENGLTLIVKKANFDKDNVFVSVTVNGGGNNMLSKELQAIPYLLSSFIQTGGTVRAPERVIQKEMQTKMIKIGIAPISLYSYGVFGQSNTKYFDSLVLAIKEMLFEPGFRISKFDKVKELYIEQLKQQEKDPSFKLNTAYNQFLHSFAPSTYNPTEKDVNNLSIDSLKEIYNKYFQPSSMTIVVVSTIDEDKVVDLFSKYLGKQSNNKISDIKGASNFIFPKGTYKKTLYEYNENKAEVIMSYPGLWMLDKDTFKLMFFSTILTNKLNDVVREENSGTYSIGAQYQPFISYKGGVMEINFITDPKKVTELIGKVKEIIKNYQQKGVTEEEIQKAMEPSKKDFDEMQKSNMGWMTLLSGTNEFYGITADFYFILFQNTIKLNKLEINEAIKKYINVDGDYIEFVNYPKQDQKK